MYDGTVRIEYQHTLLVRHRGKVDRRQKRLTAVDHPTLYHTAFASPQGELFELDDEQWRKVLELPARQRYRRRVFASGEQLPLPLVGTLLLLLIRQAA